MTKEEKIKEAYSEHWETVKDFVDENGWLNSKELYRDVGNSKRLIGLTLDICNPYDPKYCYYKRPVSLSGIENNNGWIKIESEADLPKEKMYLFLIDKKKGLDEKPYPFNPDIDACIRELLVFHSHYQPIVKPKPPIY
ncbi:MAG: hypothetical protein ACRC8Z_10760 [Empedobacter falsenii]